jgi:hypothetical protein
MGDAASQADRELYQRQIARPVLAERGVDATDREIDKLVACEWPQRMAFGQADKRME